MAAAAEILDQLHRSGVLIRAEGDRLIAESDRPLSDDARALIRGNKPALLRTLQRDRWNPELAAEGYVWCPDCRHWNGVTCSHPDNPFRNQQPLAPRKCRWFTQSTE